MCGQWDLRPKQDSKGDQWRRLQHLNPGQAASRQQQASPQTRRGPSSHHHSDSFTTQPRKQTSSQSIINFHRKPATRADGFVVGVPHHKAISLTPILIATSSTPPSINLGRNRKAPPLAPAVPIGCNRSVADNKRRRPIRHRGPNSFALLPQGVLFFPPAENFREMFLVSI